MKPKLVGVGQSLPTEKSTPPVLSEFFFSIKLVSHPQKGSFQANIKVCQKPLDCFKMRIWIDGTLKLNSLSFCLCGHYVQLLQGQLHPGAFTASVHSKRRGKKKKERLLRMTRVVIWSDAGED